MIKLNDPDMGVEPSEAISAFCDWLQAQGIFPMRGTLAAAPSWMQAVYCTDRADEIRTKLTELGFDLPSPDETLPR